jgi:hypothetical protein
MPRADARWTNTEMGAGRIITFPSNTLPYFCRPLSPPDFKPSISPYFQAPSLVPGKRRTKLWSSKVAVTTPRIKQSRYMNQLTKNHKQENIAILQAEYTRERRTVALSSHNFKLILRENKGPKMNPVKSHMNNSQELNIPALLKQCYSYTSI